jgi:hypothetical protein
VSEECDLIYQALNSTCNCHLETTHRISQDYLLAGGHKERVEKMSKLVGQLQRILHICLCSALVLHVE